MIEQFYFTHQGESNRYFYSSQTGPESNGHKEVLQFSLSSRTGPHLQMLFDVVIRILTRWES